MSLGSLVKRIARPAAAITGGSIAGIPGALIGASLFPHSQSRSSGDVSAQDAPELADAKKQVELARTRSLVSNYQNAANGNGLLPSNQEMAAGIMPPGYASLRDASGGLQSQYKFDPYAGQATQALKDQAFSTGQSPWAKLQTDQQRMEQQNALQGAQQQNMQAQGMAQSQLARSGGLRGGAATLLARQGGRNLMNSSQDISRAGMGQRLGINQQDLARKQDLLGSFSNLEQSAQGKNLGTLTGDVANQSAFNQNRYNEQMRAWAASKSADAERAAANQANSGGGGLISNLVKSIF